MRPIPYRRRASGGRFKQFLSSFRPRNFKGYWLSKAGLWRVFRLSGHGLLLIFLLVLFIARDLPSPGKINARIGQQTTRFYDRTGQTVLYEVFGNKNRSVVKFDQIPANLKEATIAVEDKNFYKHGAFSVFGIGRAFTGVLFRNPNAGGGSTITQQYVKNALLSPERSYTRKVRELILSVILEQFYRKDDILSLYLNEIPYGTNAYGIQAAAKTYFDVDAKKLTLKQASILAAIPRAPTFYSPYGTHKDRLVARQNLILDLMAEQHYITQKQANAAKLKSLDDLAHSVRRTPNYFANIIAPHFVFYVEEQLEAKYGAKAVTEGGLKVITTLDLKKQKIAEQSIADGMGGVRAFGGSNAAMVSTDPKNGQMLAMVGSYDFNDPKFGAYNVATGGRQPGSSFKPFAYATAFGQNYGAGSTLYDVPTDFGGGYKPHNFCFCNYGVRSIRQSLGGSLNVPAVKTLYIAGIDKTIATAKSMGISTLNSPDQYGLSLVLGSADVKVTEMANAYESFANGGMHHEQTTVLKITDPSGKTLEEYKDKEPQKVIDPQVAWLISDILSDNPSRAYVFGCLLCMPDGRKVAIKTGTTENFRDAWTMGYTPSLVGAVWTGNNDNKPMSSAAADISAPILKEYMAKALAGKPHEDFVRPTGLKRIKLDGNTGKLPAPGAKNLRTDWFPSWYKPTNFTQSHSAVIDKVSGKLATACTPDAAKQTVYATEIHAEIPAKDPAYPRWEAPVQALARRLGYKNGGVLPTTKDDVHSCDDAKPQVDLTATDLGMGYFKLQNIVSAGKFTPKTLTVYLDDQIISTQSINGSTNYTFATHITENGGHQFKAKVTDSGYYEATDTVDVTVTDAGTFEGNTPSEGSHQSAVSINFTWSDLPGATDYTLYYRRGSGSYTSIGAIGVNHHNVSGPFPPGTYQWYVEANSSGTLAARSAVISFFVP